MKKKKGQNIKTKSAITSILYYINKTTDTVKHEISFIKCLENI